MTTKERYLQLLNSKDFPATPQNLPNKVFLPNESIGDLEKAILETLSKNIEFSQTISWKKDSFVKSKLIMGNGLAVSDGWLGTFKEFFYPKPLLGFHTHPTDGDERASYEFSSYDVAQFKAFPRDSYIELCGSRLGVAALLQTEQSARLPLSSYKFVRQIERWLDETNFELLPQYKQAILLERLGYGYYTWKPTRNRVYPGNLDMGITLSRIFPFKT